MKRAGRGHEVLEVHGDQVAGFGHQSWPRQGAVVGLGAHLDALDLYEGFGNNHIDG